MYLVTGEDLTPVVIGLLQKVGKHDLQRGSSFSLPLLYHKESASSYFRMPEIYHLGHGCLCCFGGS